MELKGISEGEQKPEGQAAKPSFEAKRIVFADFMQGR